jgi:hypothetical protein
MVAKEQAQRDRRQSFEQQVLATASQMELPLDQPTPVANAPEEAPQEPAQPLPPPPNQAPPPPQAPTVGSLFIEGTMGVRSIPADVLLRHKRG